MNSQTIEPLINNLRLFLQGLEVTNLKTTYKTGIVEGKPDAEGNPTFERNGTATVIFEINGGATAQEHLLPLEEGQQVEVRA
jgi:hypothetical protein